MNIWQYLDNKNKRRHLADLIKKCEERDRRNAALSNYIDPGNNDIKIRLWHNEFTKIKEEMEDLKEKLLKLL